MGWESWDDIRKREDERQKREDDRRKLALKEQKEREAAKLARKEKEAKKEKAQKDYEEKQKKIQSEYDKMLGTKEEEKKVEVRLSRGFGFGSSSGAAAGGGERRTVSAPPGSQMPGVTPAGPKGPAERGPTGGPAKPTAGGGGSSLRRGFGF